jgi:hypothetical protein
MKYYENKDLIIDDNKKKYDVFQKGRLDDNISILITRKRFLNIFPHINGIAESWEYDKLKQHIELYFKVNKSKEFALTWFLKDVDKKYVIFQLVNNELSKVDNFMNLLESYKVMLTLLNEI